MKKAATIIALLIALLPAFASHPPADNLYLKISLTRGERSRDSNSRTTTITLSGNEIAYDVTYAGARANKRVPVHKKFRITPEDIKRIENLIEARNLLASDSFQYSNQSGGGPSRYFKIAINIRMGKKESLIEISGPRGTSEIKNEKRYENPTALVEEIFRIIKSQDDEIVDEEVIN